VAIYNRQFASFWCNAKVLGVPTLILWLIVFLLISIFVYNYTPFGNYVKATGGNRVAARYSGINTDRIVIMVMTISGAFAGICGLFLTARMNQGRPDFGSGLGLDAVTAAILGGTPFSGGKGSIFLSLMGALVLATLQDGLIIMGLTTELINIVKGVIIIAAVAISSNRGSR
jgi:ribose transport system permease protein